MTDGGATDDETAGTESDALRREEGRGDDSAGEREGDAGDGSSHLDGVEDGAGCTEIWERLSERREE